MSKWVMAALLCSSLAACGGGSGGSGVSGSKALGTLSNGDITEICEYLISLVTARTVDCGNGETVMIEPESLTECTAELMESRDMFPSCTATVRNLENCSEDIADFTDAQICSDTPTFPDSCLPLFSSTCGG